jgi:hypothetical protein
VQDYDIPHSANFIAAMHDALTRSRHLIVLLTKDYAASRFTMMELTNFLATAGRSADERRLVVLRVDDCDPEGIMAGAVFGDLWALPMLANVSGALWRQRKDDRRHSRGGTSCLRMCRRVMRDLPDATIISLQFMTFRRRRQRACRQVRSLVRSRRYREVLTRSGIRAPLCQ